ncbi:cytospin-A-like isoform X2 [Boleophthalmus pectinirostris]|uniref:cytospin-A-like isoform X2 n=1 Tax=Boleophthalmus pectinirostris TaxID=150288 RepID=UPI00243230F5|nr:cytospin-A-like isoform X2 [Boleophthalmus pectinirostris]
MGNNAGKDSRVSTGSPLDFFQTPPTTPSEAVLSAMMASSQASSDSDTSPQTAACTTPFTPTSPLQDWAHKLSSPSEWAVISVDSIANVSSDTTAVLSPDSPREEAPSSGSSSEQSWQERDSGLEPQAAVERANEEMSLVLLSLMEHYQSSMGLAPNTDLTSGAVELLRHLLTERDVLTREVQRLRETLRTEREDWQQFQCDLQVAVSVADRLRVESDQAVDSLQDKCKTLEEELHQALIREQAKDSQLKDLKADHKVACRKLIELTLQKQQAARRTRQSGETQRQDSEERQDKVVKEAPQSVAEKSNEDEQKYLDVLPNPENSSETGGVGVTGKGVAECYLRSLAALERKKERASLLKDSRSIVMLSERSWSLSRLPLLSEGLNAQEENTSTTLPLCKKEETKGRRIDKVLQRQDSWSSFYTVAVKKEEDADSIKPQDGFSALLRRHGGSRRNSLLRWSQERTQGYENIDITNFSSSWEDGLAFCALFHTYLPGAIPFDTLKPENKNGNLNLAFKTGETVGITATLTVEDMLKADGPDWQRVLNYVESIFRHFEM